MDRKHRVTLDFSIFPVTINENQANILLFPSLISLLETYVNKMSRCPHSQAVANISSSVSVVFELS